MYYVFNLEVAYTNVAVLASSMCYPCVIWAASGAGPGAFLAQNFTFSAKDNTKNAGNALNHVRLTR